MIDKKLRHIVLVMRGFVRRASLFDHLSVQRVQK